MNWLALLLAVAALGIAAWAAAEARASRRAAERSAAAAERHVLVGEGATAAEREARAAILKLGEAQVRPAPPPWQRRDMLDVEIVNAGQGPARNVRVPEIWLDDWGWTKIGVSEVSALAAGEQIVISALIVHEMRPFPFRLRVSWEDSLGQRIEDLRGDITIPWPPPPAEAAEA